MVKSLGVLFEAGLADNTKKAQHGGAVSVAGDHYKVIQENDKVRILEFRGKPVDKTEMHSHSNIVAIPMSDAKVRFTGATGQSMEIELGAGQAMYMDADEHATEILGDTESHVILVELK